MPLGSEASGDGDAGEDGDCGGCGRDDQLWCWMKTLVMRLLWSECLYYPHPDLTAET